MATFSLSDATIRARAAYDYAGVIVCTINDAVKRGACIDDETASEILAMVQYVIDQSHDTIKEA